MLEPAENSACRGEFPNGYEFVGTTPEETQALFRSIWLDGVSRGDYRVSLGSDELAKDARCIAVGPHRDLNIQNWCCR